VQTTVQAVGSFTLTSDANKIAAPGTTVYMPHTLTNTGNSSDSFTVSLPATLTTNQATDLSSIALYLDSNFDGQPDTTTPICSINTAAPTACTTSTGTLASGGQYGFVVAMVVKSNAPNNDVSAEVITATPATPSMYVAGTTSPPATNGAAYGTNAEKINTDTLTINNTSAVINVTKSIIGSTSGPFGTVVTYHLNYTNSGNAAGPVYISDVMGSGATVGSNYIAGSAKWSNPGVGLTAMTDAVDAQGNGSQYSASPLPSTAGQTAAATATTITAAIYSVPANGSGYFEYQAVVLNTAVLGTSTTTNVASYGTPTTCTVDATPCTAPTTSTNTNNTPFDVTGLYSVVANNDATLTTDGDNTTASGFDLVSIATAAPGDTITFNNHIHNTGNSADTYNITLGSVTAGLTAFPTGTTFAMYQSNGTTPLGDTNGDSIPDTGNVLPGSDYVVVVKATLPAGATAGGPYSESVTATSTQVTTPATPTTINTVFDQLGAVVVGNLTLAPNGNNQIYPGGTVYYPHTLTNNGNSSCGATNYSITVTNNQSAANWQYNVYYDTDGNGAVDSGEPLLGGGIVGTSFTTTALPALAASTSKALIVKVTAPAGAASGDVDAISMLVSTSCANVPGTVTTPTVIDTTTVVLGQLRIAKTQAITSGACGTAPASTAFGSGALTAKPGDCIC